MSTSNGQWQAHSFTFTTSGATTVLAFQSLSTNPPTAGPAIDNVTMDCAGGPDLPPPGPNPCCPPWDGERARGVFTLQPGPNLNQPNTLQFNPAAAQTGALRAYANLVSWMLYGAPNLVRVNIDFRLFSGGAIGMGTSGTSPVLGAAQTGTITKFWTSTTGPLPALPVFFTTPMPPNSWFIITTQIRLTHATTGQAITYFGPECSNVAFPFNVMTRAALAGAQETDARSRELVLVTVSPEGRLVEVPRPRTASERD